MMEHKRSIPTLLTQGVSIEIRRALPKGWTLSEKGSSFVVAGNLTAHCDEQVWKIAQFVSYRAFHALSCTAQSESEVRYELLSDNGRNLGFRVEFILSAMLRIHR